jgi:hypothetical protein
MPFLDILNRVPTDSQMMSHVCHGHVFAQIPDIALEALGISAIRLSKPSLHLPRDSTVQTEDSLNGKLDNSAPQTNRKSDEPPDYFSFLHDSPTPAYGTCQGCMILTYSKDRPAILETSMNVTHSTSSDPKAVIKYACGHDFLAFQDLYQTQEG